MPSPELILFPRLAGADQIAQRFVCFIGNPYGGQITSAVAACEFFRIPPVRLHPVARFYRDQSRCNHLTFHTELGELPVEHVPGWPGFVTGAEFLHRSEFPDHLTD